MAAHEHRAVIQYCMLRRFSTAEAHNELVSAYSKACPSLSTVRRWRVQFRHGKTSLDIDPGSRRQPEGTTDENVYAVHTMIVDDRRFTVKHMAEVIKISPTSVYKILHKTLHMKTLSTRWIPRLLTPVRC